MNQICGIMPAYGFPEMTKKCVEMVRENAGMDLDMLVVDDGSKEPIKIPGENVLRLDKNTGFTNATNQGILWCGDRYKYLLFLNNDIIPDPNFVKPLYDHMESDPVTGIAGAVRWVMYNGKKHHMIHGVDLLRGNQGVMFECNPETPVMYCDWLPTCAALIRMEMVRYIGILDRRFKQHCSDSEYCFRANRNWWSVAVIPMSKVQHNHQTTIQHLKIDPTEDQKKMVEILAGTYYQNLMNKLPLDCDENTWGKITFDKYKKYAKESK